MDLRTRHEGGLRGTTLACILGILLLAGGPHAEAGVIGGESAAFGISINLAIATVPIADLGSGQTDATAPPAYDTLNTQASFNASAGIAGVFPLVVSTGVINDHVQSDVDGTLGSRFALGESSVEDLDLVLGLDTLITDPLLSLGSNGTITSSARLEGDFGNLAANLDAILEGLQISVLGTDLDLGLDADGRAAPNTGIDTGIGGLSILLNEQASSGNPNDGLSAGTNAIHVLFTGVDLGATGMLYGDIIVAHSDARLTAQDTGTIPAPSPLILLTAGLLGLLRSLRIGRANARA